MDYDDFIQAAETDWLSMSETAAVYGDNIEEYNWPWFWIILATALFE